MSYNSYRGIEIAAINLSEAFSNLNTLVEEGPDALNEYERKACRRLFVQAIEIVELFIEAANNEHFKITRLHVENLHEKLTDFVESNFETAVEEEDEDNE